MAKEGGSSCNATQEAGLLSPFSRLSLQPRRRPLLILDVNGLLLYRVRKAALRSMHIGRRPDASARGVAVFLRPHALSFVRWCAEEFALVVWSTAAAHNVSPLVDLVFRDSPPPLAVFDGSHCTATGRMHPHEQHKPLVLKQLSTVWSHDALRHFSARDTLLLDDSPYKAAANPQNTSLHPPAWAPHAEGEDAAALGPHGAIRMALAAVGAAADTREAVLAVRRSDPAFWADPEGDPLYRLLREEHLRSAEAASS
ncbi:hypothetical protein AB1Y20_013506 [Prymnesium parvum]|uniref:Mitochondrial import inner membrane translocase subunit TIM50 n=1 Tax=Prymnesium parvum TaxID=97485 RepID=A0AB34IIF9_PRYPA